MQNNANSHEIKKSFWIISSIFLVWNLMGVLNFFMQMSPEFIASMPETHQKIIELRPFWGTISFAIAVIGGAIGCILLLLKKAISYNVFLISLGAVVITMIPHLGIIGSVISDPFEIIMMIVMPILVALFLAWYSKYSIGKKWIQ